VQKAGRAGFEGDFDLPWIRKTTQAYLREGLRGGREQGKKRKGTGKENKKWLREERVLPQPARRNWEYDHILKSISTDTNPPRRGGVFQVRSWV